MAGVNTYHHGDLRNALVVAAADLARSHGPHGVVLREVARRTGVSHNAAYRHFSDRDELLAAVAALAMDQLEDAMLLGLDTVTGSDPGSVARGRLRQVGHAYVTFALDQPGLFEVAFAGHQPEGDPVGVHPTGGPDGVLGRVLDELVDAGELTVERRAGADVVCWAAVHGFATLHLRGPLRHTPPNGREPSLRLLLDTVERGLTRD